MVNDGKGSGILNTKASNNNPPSTLSLEKGEIKDLGYADAKLKITNKHKNIQDGIFKLIAPNGKFMDYNNPNYVDPITSVSGDFSAHMARPMNEIITVSESWDNNAMPDGEMWTMRNAANNKALLEGFFSKGIKKVIKIMKKEWVLCQ